MLRRLKQTLERFFVADPVTSEAMDLLDRKLKGYPLTAEQEQILQRYWFPNRDRS